MLKIGEFSKLSRVSIRMLRRYNGVGLLLPAEIDPITGYRYHISPHETKDPEQFVTEVCYPVKKADT